MKDFLTDEEMQKLESGQTAEMPDFIPDEQADSFFNQKPAAPKPFRYDVGTLTPQEQKVEQNRKLSKYKMEADQAQAEANKYKGFGFVKEFAKGLPFLGAPIRQGEATGEQLATGDVANSLLETHNQNVTQQTNILKQIREKDARGEDTRGLKIAYNHTADDATNVEAELDRMVPGWRQTYKEAIGNLGEMATDILSAGTYGKGAFGSKSGVLDPTFKKLPSAVQAIRKVATEPAKLFTKRTAVRSAVGGAVGEGYDIATNLQNNEKGTDIFTKGSGKYMGAAIPVAAGLTFSVKSRFGKEARKARIDQAVNDLEDKYEDIHRGWIQTRKASEKAKRVTELKNKSGTIGRRPERVLAENGIVPQHEGTEFTTRAQANKLREQVKPLRDANRTALKEAQLSTAPISIRELEQEAIKRARSAENIAAGTADDLERGVVKQMQTYRKNYGENIPLQVLDDVKSARWNNTGFSLTRDDKLASNIDYIIGKTAQETIEETAAKAGAHDVAQLNREIGDILEGAKFLENLDGKKVLYGRMGTHMTRLSGTIIGSSVGGVAGGIAGTIGGDVVANILRSTSIAGPVKRLILKNLEKKNPEAYIKTLAWLKKQGLDRDIRLLLPAGQKGKPFVPNQFVTPKGVSTSLKQEAADLHAVESGVTKTSVKRGRPKNPIIPSKPYLKESEMPVIDAGKVPKKKSALPVVKEAPNVFVNQDRSRSQVPITNAQMTVKMNPMSKNIPSKGKTVKQNPMAKGAIKVEAGKGEILTKTGKVNVIRYSKQGYENSDKFRGGTWYTTPESKSYNFTGTGKRPESVGGPVRTEKSISMKKPLIIKNASVEDGSFAVINSGYEHVLPKKNKDLAERAWELTHNSDMADGQKLSELGKILRENGNSQKEISDALLSVGNGDVAIDLIISKGLKQKGYDGIVLTNEFKGKELDRHIFKFGDSNPLTGKK